MTTTPSDMPEIILFRAGKFGVQLIGDRAGDFSFDPEDVVELTIIAFGPEMLICRSANQLHIDVHRVSDFLHAAYENMRHA